MAPPLGAAAPGRYDARVSATDRLLEIMARLRDPEEGCPWDLEQDFESLAPYAIEEAYEVEDAIRRGDPAHLREELGDLLLQVVFQAQIAREKGLFDFEDVAGALADKLVARHPHVFGDAEVRTAAAQEAAWERAKESERQERGEPSDPLSAVPRSLPALLRAAKLARRAARAGHPLLPAEADPGAVLGPGVERLAAAIREGTEARAEEALGALLLQTAAVAATRGLDPEAALRRAADRLVEARRDTPAPDRDRPA